ncbi:MAG: helix-turn-helix domain-containing protein [Methylovulum sp.]|nr:helix-turn-helix domain-containing protein [Methylovulum sp.]
MTKSTTTTLVDVIAKIDLLTKAVLSNKNVLSIEELAAYANLSVSHIYKLTSTQQIPHFKPRGKLVYFNRSEIDEWLLQNRVATASEIEQKAADHLAVGGAK